MEEVVGYEIRKDKNIDGGILYDVYCLTSCDCEYLDTFMDKLEAWKYIGCMVKDRVKHMKGE